MKKLFYVMILLALALMVGACGAAEKKEKVTDEKIVISAAASLQEALTEIKGNFIKARNLKEEQVSINFGGSGTLRRQIEQGAPSSLFISASESHMKALAEKDAVSNVITLLTNELVIIVPKGKPAYNVQNLRNMTRFAVGEPQTVPAGRYAMDALMHFQVWQELHEKAVFAKDVRSVLAYVREATVDAGFVYRTDALQGKDRVTITDTLPADSHEPIVYPMALVKKNQNELAKDFYAYLLTEDARTVFTKYGFGIGQK